MITYTPKQLQLYWNFDLQTERIIEALLGYTTSKDISYLDSALSIVSSLKWSVNNRLSSEIVDNKPALSDLDPVSFASAVMTDWDCSTEIHDILVFIFKTRKAETIGDLRDYYLIINDKLKDLYEKVKKRKTYISGWNDALVKVQKETSDKKTKNICSRLILPVK